MISLFSSHDYVEGGKRRRTEKTGGREIERNSIWAEKSSAHVPFLSNYYPKLPFYLVKLEDFFSRHDEPFVIGRREKDWKQKEIEETPAYMQYTSRNGNSFRSGSSYR